MTKYKVIVSPSAKAQIKGITAHIRDKLFNPQAAKAIALAIKSAIASLATMPERTTEVSSVGLRRMVVRNYLIYYQIDEAARQVFIHAVIYGKRDQESQIDDILQN